MGIKTHVGRYHSHVKKKYPCRMGCGKFFGHNFEATRHAKSHCRLNREAGEAWKEAMQASGKAAREKKRQQERRQKMRDH